MTISNTDMRRKRIRFRAWHRGMRETDLLLGRFADATVATLDDNDLASFEALLELPDQDVLAWLTEQASVPADQDTPLFRRLKYFHDHDRPLHV